MSKKSKKHRDHDEKTCFRCRLHALVVELNPKGISSKEGRFCLIAMAEASGQILAQLDSKDKILFMIALAKFETEAHLENSNSTMH